MTTLDELEEVMDKLALWKKTPIGFACFKGNPNPSFEELFQTLLDNLDYQCDLSKFMAASDFVNFNLTVESWEYGVELLATEYCFEPATQ